MVYCLRLKIVSLLICSVSFFLISCSQKQPDIVQLAPLPENICRVAALPFINKTKYRDGGVLFYRVFVSELSRFGDFEVVPEGDVRKAFRQIRVAYGQQANYDQLRIIGDYLDTDILVGGIILQMEEVPAKNEDIPYMTVQLSILDAESGKTLWSIYHVRDGSQYRKVMHFGIITTITQLARQISREILENWAEEGFTGKCIK